MKYLNKMFMFAVGSVLGSKGLGFGLFLRLGLVSRLYNWLFYLATVR